MTRRREFSKATRREAFERSGGLCECAIVPQLPTYGVGCGCKLTSGNIWYEHIDPDGAGGSNTIENCAALTKTCARLKSRIFDAPTVAKTIRMRDGLIGADTKTSRPLPGTIRSGIKLSLSNRCVPIWRDSGKPLHERR